MADRGKIDGTMPHTIERATSGRAKCRACGGKIAAGELRLGERLPNPFADEGGEMTHWFHVRCAADRRPEAFLDAVAATNEPIEDRAALEHGARLGVAHHRLPRASAVSRAPTGRATCRSCREPIEKDAWRIALVFYEEGRFMPSGYIHARCAREYFGTPELMDRLRRASPEVSGAEWREVEAEIRA